MKLLAIFMIVVLWSAPVYSFEPLDYTKETETTFADKILVYDPSQQHSMVFRDDGVILLDNKPIEQLSHHEIKEILAAIFKELKEQNEQRSMVMHFNRQTDYLLMELETCRAGQKTTPREGRK